MTVKVALVPGVRVSPDVRVAVSVTPVPGVDKVTPDTTTWFVPAVIVPVVVPPIVPAFPFVVSVKPVFVTTFDARLPASCDCTVTLKPLPAVGEAGEILVIASFVGVDATGVVVTVTKVPFSTLLVVVEAVSVFGIM